MRRRSLRRDNGGLIKGLEKDAGKAEVEDVRDGGERRVILYIDYRSVCYSTIEIYQVFEKKLQF